MILLAKLDVIEYNCIKSCNIKEGGRGEYCSCVVEDNCGCGCVCGCSCGGGCDCDGLCIICVSIRLLKDNVNWESVSINREEVS